MIEADRDGDGEVNEEEFFLHHAEDLPLLSINTPEPAVGLTKLAGRAGRGGAHAHKPGTGDGASQPGRGTQPAGLGMAAVARGGGPGAGARAKGKAAVLALVEGTRRGLAADEARRGEIEAACRALEALNPEREPLASPALSGKWRLVYTTRGSILGKSRPALFRPRGPIYQVLDGKKLKARNNETSPTFSSVTAGLTPMSKSEVAVQFEQFKIGGIIPIKAPESAKGTVSTCGRRAGRGRGLTKKKARHHVLGRGDAGVSGGQGQLVCEWTRAAAPQGGD